MKRAGFALALALVASPAAAQVRAQAPVILSSGALAIESLPAGTLPTPGDPQKIPPVFRGETPDEVRITLDGGASLAAFRKKKQQNNAAWVTLDGKADHPVWFDQAGQQPQLRVVCGNQYGVRGMPLRWLALKRAGTAMTVEISDGWLDVLGCSISVEHRVSLSVAPLVSLDGIPIALAFRDPASESVTLLFPPGQSVAAESLGRDLSVPQSVLDRVTLPVVKGGASSAAMGFWPPSSPEWPKVFGVTSAPNWQNNTTTAGIEVTIDVVSAVADARPTLLVRAETAR